MNIVATLLVLAGPAAGNGPAQLVTNPFFSEWAGARPVGWSVLGNPSVWWTDSLGGAKRTVSVGAGAAGGGIMQRIAVTPGQRYFVRAFTGTSRGAPGEMLVRDVGGDEVLFRRGADRVWPQEHSGFFTAKGNEIDLIFRSIKGGGLSVDKVTLKAAVPDPTPSRVPVPKVPVFYASYDPRWVDALGAINVVSGGTDDVEFLADLRRRGVLCLPTVQIPGRGKPVEDLDAAVEAALAHWVRPFHETGEGVFPGGPDGVIIDELEAFEDDAPRLAVWEKALAELRRLYPKKIIAVWGSNSIGALTKDGKPRGRVMKMLAKWSDLFMIEIYQATCPRNPGPGWVTGQRGYGRNLPAFSTAARVIGENCPELLPKTVGSGFRTGRGPRRWLHSSGSRGRSSWPTPNRPR